MIFANADDSIAPAIHHAVSITHLGLRRDRLSLRSVRNSIKSLVNKVREINSVVIYQKTTASVLVDASAGVEWTRCDIRRLSSRLEFNNYIAAFFLRPCLDPVDGFSAHCDLPQSNGTGNNQVGCYRRFPGSVSINLYFRHQSLPLKVVFLVK